MKTKFLTLKLPVILFEDVPFESFYQVLHKSFKYKIEREVDQNYIYIYFIEKNIDEKFIIFDFALFLYKTFSISHSIFNEKNIFNFLYSLDQEIYDTKDFTLINLLKLINFYETQPIPIYFQYQDIEINLIPYYSAKEDLYLK